jgi:hypothetical protein
MFDHSYAAAWQVGRLLGLNDAGFTQSLIAWRRSELSARQAAPALNQGAQLMQVNARALGRSAPEQLKAQSMARMASALATSKDALPKRARRGQRNLAQGTLASAEDFRAQVARGEDPVGLLLDHIQRHR